MKATSTAELRLRLAKSDHAAPAASGRGRVERMDAGSRASAWLVRGYDEYKVVASDSRFSADHFHPGYPSVFPVKRRRDAAGAAMPRTYSGMDPPCHGRHRRLVSREFSREACALLEPSIRALARKRLDLLSASERGADLVHDYAEPLALDAISYLVGVPPEERDEWLSLSKWLLGAGRDRDGVSTASERFRACLSRLIAAREVEPRTDLTSRLIGRYRAVDDYDQGQIVEFVGAIFLAGVQSSASMIALGALTLIDHPAAIEPIMTGDEAALHRTVEELLRFHSIAERVTARVALQDVEIGGVLIAAGEGIVASVAAANMDPSVFERPLNFEPGRLDNQHLAFGYGRHRCLGQHLAPALIGIGLTELFTRFPGLSLAAERPPVDGSGVFHRLGGPLIVALDDGYIAKAEAGRNRTDRLATGLGPHDGAGAPSLF